MQIPDSQDLFLLPLLAKTGYTENGWAAFMSAFVSHFDLRSCHLMVVHNQTHAIRFHLESGELTHEPYLTEYVNKYISQDKTLSLARRAQPGYFFATHDMDGSHAFYQSSYYRLWALPQNIVEGAAACIYSDDEWRCLMVHNRRADQGRYSQELLARMNALIDFIANAVRTSQAQSNASSNTDLAAIMVQGYRAPAALLNPYGKIRAINARMQAMLDQHPSLHIRDQCFHLDNPTLDRQLTNSIFMASKQTVLSNKNETELDDTLAIDADTTLAFKGIRNRSKDQTTSSQGVLIYAIGHDCYSAPSDKSLARLFALTQSEARVCNLVLIGKELKEIAKIENKSINTVREQLYQSFRKTGCNSQASLINLLANIPVFDH